VTPDEFPPLPDDGVLLDAVSVGPSILDLVLDLVRTIALVVAAVALVIIAVAVQ
jgi:hypothetical protein